MIESKSFVTFEDLTEHLIVRTHFNPPRVMSGRKIFFSSFSQWLLNFDDDKVERDWCCIYPDPTLSIVYPYPMDEIAIALSNSKKCNNHADCLTLLNEFGLSEEVVSRPSLTLSGGELMLLNLAKYSILCDKEERIIVCTPTQWLNKSKYHLLDKFFSYWNNNGNTIELLTLDGENLEGNIRPLDFLKNLKIRLNWTLNFSNLKIEFPKQSFPRLTNTKTIKYLPQNFSFEMESPTLIVGDNGIGKSVFVKMLSTILEPTDGYISATSAGKSGSGRLIFQNNVIQLFGENITQHFNRVFKYDKDKGGKANTVFQKMIMDFQKLVSDDKNLRKKALIMSEDKPPTILQIKFALIAERIASETSILILDEPEWLLSQTVTEMFITTVINNSHDYNIPVLIISHLEEWYSSVKSFLHFEYYSDTEVIVKTKNLSYEHNKN